MAERLSEKYRNYLAPEAVVWINGRKLSERQVYFTELTVEQSLDAASSFSFTVSDAIDMEFEPRHADLFRFGDLVEIHIGYADSASPRSCRCFSRASLPPSTGTSAKSATSTSASRGRITVSC